MVGQGEACFFDDSAKTFEDGQRFFERGADAGFDPVDDVFARDADAHAIDVAVQVFGEVEFVVE